jgi:hypothetical protein
MARWEFYARRHPANEDIVKLCPQQAEALFIPHRFQKRSYGCGSPVQDAVAAGETWWIWAAGWSVSRQPGWWARRDRSMALI